MIEHGERGTTLVEVLTAMAVLSIIVVAMWSGFASSISLVKNIPESIDRTIDLVLLQRAFDREFGRVRVPYWTYEFEPEDDATSIVLPYCDGHPWKNLLIEFKDSHIVLSTESSDDEKEIDPPEPVTKLGPFRYFEYEYVEDEDENLIGIEFTLTPMENMAEPTVVFVRFTFMPMWKTS